MDLLTELVCADINNETRSGWTLKEIWDEHPQFLVHATPVTATLCCLLAHVCLCQAKHTRPSLVSLGRALLQEHYLQTSGFAQIMQALRNIDPASQLKNLVPQYGILMALAASACGYLLNPPRDVPAYMAGRNALQSTAARDEYLRGLEAAVANPATCRAPQAFESTEMIPSNCLYLLGEVGCPVEALMGCNRGCAPLFERTVFTRTCCGSKALTQGEHACPLLRRPSHTAL